MRSMTFSTNVEAAGSNRAWAAGITALVHALLAAGLLMHTMGQRGTPHDAGARDIVFTLTPPLPVRGPAPSVAPTPPGASAVHASPGGMPGSGHAAPARPAPVAPVPVPAQVAVLAPPEPEAIREPAPQSPAPTTAAQAATAEPAASRGPSAPVMVPVTQGDGGSDERKTIVLQNMGSSVGSYTFPALAGVDDREMTELFTVEKGTYPDLQTAMVNHIIRQIRARYPDEIKWDSNVRGGVVTLSMRIEDHETLVKFLRVELFGKRRVTNF